MTYFLLAGLVAWVAKVAESRGRFVVGWGFGALTMGAVVFMASSELIPAGAARLAGSGDRDGSTALAIGVAALPSLLLIATMAAAVVVLKRLPIKTSSGSVWPVQNAADRLGEPGQLSLERGAIRIELANAPRSIPITTLRGATADGECVRVSWDADGTTTELVLMPLGKPDTPDGRRQQSRVIARRVTAHIAGDPAAPLPAARLLARKAPPERS